MSDRREAHGLTLPGKLAWTVLQVAAALAGGSCGDDDGAPADTGPVVDMAPSDLGERDADGDAAADARVDDARIEDAVAMDTGPTDAEPDFGFLDFGPPELFCIYDSSLDAGIDANVCGTTVSNPDDCPPGCRAVG